MGTGTFVILCFVTKFALESATRQILQFQGCSERHSLWLCCSLRTEVIFINNDNGTMSKDGYQIINVVLTRL